MSARPLDGGALAGGFADPVFDAQRVFRALLDAMARPGRVVPLGPHAAPPAPLSATAAALLLALADPNTPVFLDAPLAASPAVRAYIGFHAGAPIVATPGEAAFAVAADPVAMPPLSAFPCGTPDYPDRSATLILQVASLGGDGPGLGLAGPGIEESARLAVAPLPAGFAAAWAANRAIHPCGVDLVFAGPASVAAMPRSTRLLAAEGIPCT
jgi:alpha-D-ribose 1-methylphosphonate 5-triphosphate synthase subunit PhnH